MCIVGGSEVIIEGACLKKEKRSETKTSPSMDSSIVHATFPYGFHCSAHPPTTMIKCFNNYTQLSHTVI